MKLDLRVLTQNWRNQMNSILNERSIRIVNSISKLPDDHCGSDGQFFSPKCAFFGGVLFLKEHKIYAKLCTVRLKNINHNGSLLILASLIIHR